MIKSELKQKLISKINLTENSSLLEDMYRLIAIHEIEADIFKLTLEQNNEVEIAQKQYKNGQFLSQLQADKEIDEWLEK